MLGWRRVDFILGDRVFGMMLPGGVGQHAVPLQPPWALVLSFEHKLRREAMQRVIEKGETLREAMSAVVKDPELKEGWFTTPLMLTLLSRRQSTSELPPKAVVAVEVEVARALGARGIRERVRLRTLPSLTISWWVAPQMGVKYVSHLTRAPVPASANAPTSVVSKDAQPRALHTRTTSVLPKAPALASPPCNAFSRIRGHGPGPRPIRSRLYVKGFPWLSRADRRSLALPSKKSRQWWFQIHLQIGRRSQL
jgi:hypothetical protein